MARTTDIVSVSVPRDVRKELSRLAQKEGRTQSAILLEAFRYMQISREFDRAQRIIARYAKRRGLKTEEDVLRTLSVRA